MVLGYTERSFVGSVSLPRSEAPPFSAVCECCRNTDINSRLANDVKRWEGCGERQQDLEGAGHGLEEREKELKSKLS